MLKYYEKNATLKIGLTGGIGSGKSIIAKIFKVLDIPVYDADSNAKRLMETNEQIGYKLINTFGKDSFINGKLNRKYLADIVFSHKSEIEKLNNIIHPEVAKDFLLWAESMNAYKYVIFEAAILFESGWNTAMDKTILVEAPDQLRIARTIKRDKTSREQVLKRIKNQWATAKIKQLTDFIVLNNDKHLVLPQVIQIDQILKNS